MRRLSRLLNWMAVVAGAESFKPVDAKFRTWLYRIASNKVADFFRKKANLAHAEFDTVNEQQLDEHQAPGHQLAGQWQTGQLNSEDMVLLDQLLKALSELPEEQRVTFILQQEGFSHREIADITGVGSETVKSRLLVKHRICVPLRRWITIFCVRQQGGPM